MLGHYGHPAVAAELHAADVGRAELPHPVRVAAEDPRRRIARRAWLRRVQHVQHRPEQHVRAHERQLAAHDLSNNLSVVRLPGRTQGELRRQGRQALGDLGVRRPVTLLGQADEQRDESERHSERARHRRRRRRLPIRRRRGQADGGRDRRRGIQAGRRLRGQDLQRVGELGDLDGAVGPVGKVLVGSFELHAADAVIGDQLGDIGGGRHVVPGEADDEQLADFLIHAHAFDDRFGGFAIRHLRRRRRRLGVNGAHSSLGQPPQPQHPHQHQQSNDSAQHVDHHRSVRQYALPNNARSRTGRPVRMHVHSPSACCRGKMRLVALVSSLICASTFGSSTTGASAKPSSTAAFSSA